MDTEMYAKHTAFHEPMDATMRDRMRDFIGYLEDIVSDAGDGYVTDTENSFHVARGMYFLRQHAHGAPVVIKTCDVVALAREAFALMMGVYPFLPENATRDKATEFMEDGWAASLEEYASILAYFHERLESARLDTSTGLEG